MPVSPESVSADACRRLEDARNLLVCGVNWLGDAVMSLPALTAFRARRPDRPLTMLVRPALIPFWQCVPGFERILAFEIGWGGTLRTWRRVVAGRFDAAVIQPHSFRSAWLPFAAGIPVRVGPPGHLRDFLLTHRMPMRLAPGRRHQAWETADGLGLELDRLPPPPWLEPPLAGGMDRLRSVGLDPDRDRLAVLFPGAARGPAKRWPASHFAAVGARLAGERGYRVILAGTGADRPACEETLQAMEGRAVNLAGCTGMIELAAILKRCMLVVANDSGGMHLATAVNTPVIGIFGLTDPERTGPLGAFSRVVSPPGVRGSRDIPRDSTEARRRLAEIDPDRVWREVEALESAATARRAGETGP